MKLPFRRLCFLTLLLVLTACAVEPTPTPDLVATQIVVEKAAHATMTAEAPTATWTAEPTDTVTVELTSSVGGSRDNPIPYGQVFLIHPGFELKLTGFDPDAWPEVHAENEWNDPPIEGNRLVMFRVHVKNVSGGAEPVSIDYGSFEVVGSYNVIRSPLEEGCRVIPDELDATLLEGGEVDGNICLQIPIDETDLVLVYNPDFRNLTYFEVDESAALLPDVSASAADGDFILAAEACNDELLEWALFADSVSSKFSAVCGAWREDAQSILDSLASCWEGLPEPEDDHLVEAHRSMIAAVELYRISMAEVDEFCSGSGDLDVAADSLAIANTLLHSAVEAFGVYGVEWQP